MKSVLNIDICRIFDQNGWFYVYHRIDGLNDIPNQNISITSYNENEPFPFYSYKDYELGVEISNLSLNYTTLRTNINNGNISALNGFSLTLFGINMFYSVIPEDGGLEYVFGVISNSEGYFSYRLYTKQQKIDFKGYFYFWYNLALNTSNQIVIGGTDGIFNPDKFNLGEFFKIMCVSTLKFITFGFDSNGKLQIELDTIPVDEPVSKTIDSEKILSFEKKQEIYQLQKQLDELDFSETDRHYVLYAIKSFLLSFLQPTAYKISTQLLLDSETNSISIGDVISITIEPEDIYMVNSIEKDKINYTVNLELIKLKRTANKVLDISRDKLVYWQQYSYGD
jgi:hypothetical protein